MTIAEVAKKYKITPNTLRYYERIGLLPTVNRNKSGIRDYTEQDCGWVEFIKCLRSAGLPIEVLIEYVALTLKGDDISIEAKKNILIEQLGELDRKILEMQEVSNRLKGKIEFFEERLNRRGKELSENIE